MKAPRLRRIDQQFHALEPFATRLFELRQDIADDVVTERRLARDCADP